MKTKDKTTIIGSIKHSPELVTPIDAPGFLTLLPMLYVAWSDGVLTPSEIDTIRNKLQKQDWITDSEKTILAGWLNPASPPSAKQLQNWLKIIRESGKQASESSKQSLVNFGIEIARIGAGDQVKRCTTPEACEALEEIEEVLGVVGSEAVRNILSDEKRPTEEPSLAFPEASFDVSAMMKLLDGEHAGIRHKVRRLLSDPTFRYEYGIDTATYRERVLAWCTELARQGLGALSYPEAYGGKADLGGFIAVAETVAFHDLSLMIKFGVQFGLFGGSVYQLGTEIHHKKYLRDAGSLELAGCFAMTELGHGSNVNDIETIALYDRETEEFILHTPSESARKDYIGNAALHGRMATVFAQLEIEGDSYGVHAFLVPIRDSDNSPMPGVQLEDCGEKMGLNGVDNGRIWFDHVRIPRENLLNRFAEVSSDGIYSSPIASASQRFFTMLGTLVGGRISIAAAALSAAKSAITIAIRYATRRRQFGPPGVAETLLLDYPSHQRRLLPLLANAYALDFALKYLARRYVERSEEDQREVEVLAAGLKSHSSWNATHTIQECRESCGGKGYLAENRFGALKADSEIFTTFEGDNIVLMQLVAKGLLTKFRHQFDEMKVLGLVKYLAERAATAISELNPVVTRMTDEAHLLDADFQSGAFKYRENHLLITAAKRLKKRIDQGKGTYEAFIECQNHLINLAHAYIERVVLEQFLRGIEQCPDPALADVLKLLCNLFALSRIEKDKGWFLENGYIEGAKAKAIRRQIDKLCLELRSDAVHLVDAFGISDETLAAPIATKMY